MAKKLANPISSLISLPFQNNTDLGIGNNNGSRNTLNIQPVVPITLTKDLNLIARLVLPVISQYNITSNGGNQMGLGDAVLSTFLSPSNSKGGITWGAGPAFLIPTGTDDFLGTKKWGIGPTAVALYQNKGYTIGALVNQVWSVAGDKNRGDLSTLFFQPFFNYNWKSGAGVGGNFEITQNWKGNSTNIWFNPTISAVTSLGSQKTQLAVGPRFNLASPEGAKSDIGFRAVVVFLFPK
ncbi:MAG: transporter [Flavobacteriales bacterium]|nr:MAG: transporter [Flavobacteriales bacterium]